MCSGQMLLIPPSLSYLWPDLVCVQVTPPILYCCTEFKRPSCVGAILDTSPIIAWKLCQIWEVWECSWCCLIILNFYSDPSHHPVDIGLGLLSLFFKGSLSDFKFRQIRNSLYNAKLHEIFSEKPHHKKQHSSKLYASVKKKRINKIEV